MAFVNVSGSFVAKGSATLPASSFVSTRRPAVAARAAQAVSPVTMKLDAWVQLLPTADIVPGALKGVYAASQSILVSCDYDGQVYASANICPHLGTPLYVCRRCSPGGRLGAWSLAIVEFSVNGR
jgi:Rieske [2Fe-2S] domain